MFLLTLMRSLIGIGMLILTLSLILIQTHLLTQTLKPRPTLKYSLIEILIQTLTQSHLRM
ncbi:hypothetical protein QM919_03360 [Streptococcus rubneri]